MIEGRMELIVRMVDDEVTLDALKHVVFAFDQLAAFEIIKEKFFSYRMVSK